MNYSRRYTEISALQSYIKKEIKKKRMTKSTVIIVLITIIVLGSTYLIRDFLATTNNLAGFTVKELPQIQTQLAQEKEKQNNITQDIVKETKGIKQETKENQQQQQLTGTGPSTQVTLRVNIIDEKKKIP